MNEHPLLALLALLAQFTGAYLAANNPSTDELHAFQLNIANALLQKQSASEFQQSFLFENMQSLTTQHLDGHVIMQDW
jgi:hypothetical protein